MTSAADAREEPVYDRLAAVYDRWLSGDEASGPCLAFYRDELAGSLGPVLELGVGTGRIACALAAHGTRVVGLDISRRMLARLSTEAVGGGQPAPPLGVCGRFEQLPFRTGTFGAVILPMRTIGHLVEEDSRQELFDEVHRVLAPGGRMVFDHYRIDLEWARAHHDRHRLMYAGAADGAEDAALLIWDRYTYDFPRRTLRCVVSLERLGPGGALAAVEEVGFDFRWFEAEELEREAARAGLVLESCWGSFDRDPFGPDSEHMVFVVRRA